MAIVDRLDQRDDAEPLGIGLLDRIGRGWGAWRGGDRGPQALADPHICQWRHLATPRCPSPRNLPRPRRL